MWLFADEQPTWNLWLYVISGELQYPGIPIMHLVREETVQRSTVCIILYLLMSFFNTLCYSGLAEVRLPVVC